MSERCLSTCQGFAGSHGTPYVLICALLAALLLAMIALGFGPLRAWIGLAEADCRSSNYSMGEVSSLLATWRLYRQLGRAGPSAAAFSAPDVPVLIVSGSMGASVRDGSPTLDRASMLPKTEQPMLCYP